MKIRFASRSTVVNRKHQYYLVVDVALGTASLMSYSQMPHTLSAVAHEPAVLAFKIEDVCLDYRFDPANEALTKELLDLLNKYSAEEKWVFYSRSPV